MPVFRTTSTRGFSKIPENNVYRNDDGFNTGIPDDTGPDQTLIPVCTRNPVIFSSVAVSDDSLDFSDADNSQYYVLGVL